MFNGTKQNVVAPLTMSVFFGGMMESGHRGGEEGECQKGGTTAELDRDQKEGGREESLGHGSEGCWRLRAPRTAS